MLNQIYAAFRGVRATSYLALTNYPKLDWTISAIFTDNHQNSYFVGRFTWLDAVAEQANPLNHESKNRRTETRLESIYLKF